MHRISEHGSYRLDGVFPGMGRIAVASGATTAAEFKSRNELLRNHLRRAVSHFLADQLGDVHHPWRRAAARDAQGGRAAVAVDRARRAFAAQIPVAAVTLGAGVPGGEGW